jgi:23S rRNA pseudouridine955/2504/2580 synthase
MEQDPEERCFSIGENDQGKRVDRILRNLLPQYSLGFIYRMIRKGSITLNRRKVAPTHRVSKGDILTVPSSLKMKDLPPLESRPPYSLPILYEDEDFLVLNKPRGITAHGEHSLLPSIIQYLQGKIPTSLTYTPGPLHRLDRNTTGILVFGKSLMGARLFSSALRNGLIEKQYVTILSGILEEPLRWEHVLKRDSRHKRTMLGTDATDESTGKRSIGITEVFPLAHSAVLPSGVTLAVLRIHTGRTHQIRAQASFEGHPLLGDIKYGGKKFRGGYFLHAFRLRMPNRLDLQAPLPKAFTVTIRTLFGEGIFPYTQLGATE